MKDYFTPKEKEAVARATRAADKLGLKGPERVGYISGWITAEDYMSKKDK